MVPHDGTTKAFRCAQVNATDQHWAVSLLTQDLMSRLPKGHITSTALRVSMRRAIIGTEANRRRYSISSRGKEP